MKECELRDIMSNTPRIYPVVRIARSRCFLVTDGIAELNDAFEVTAFGWMWNSRPHLRGRSGVEHRVNPSDIRFIGYGRVEDGEFKKHEEEK